jgi:hypothetical protein
VKFTCELGDAVDQVATSSPNSAFTSSSVVSVSSTVSCRSPVTMLGVELEIGDQVGDADGWMK